MPVLALGKRSSGAVGAHVCVGYSVLQNRTFLIDQSSGVSFLVDSDASVSVIPVSLVHPRSRSPPLPELALRAANDSVISVYGSRSVSLDLGFGRLFRWVFLLADVQQAILGADFLSHFLACWSTAHAIVYSTPPAIPCVHSMLLVRTLISLLCRASRSLHHHRLMRPFCICCHPFRR